jgi:hypothetical protein
MKMTYTKSAFEMPDGKYMARFVGVTMREATGQLDQRGNPMPPGMTWDFEIVEPGENKGKKTDRLTGRQPTPKSACGKILAAVTDSVLKDGQEVDLAQFVGKYYRVTVIENRVSDNPPPVLVADYRPADGPTPAADGTAPKPPGRPPAPPAKTEPRYWVALEEGKDPVLMTVAEADSAILNKGGHPDTVMVCKEGADTWEPASAVGIKGIF